MDKYDLTKVTNDELLKINKTLEDFIIFLSNESTKEEKGEENE